MVDFLRERTAACVFYQGYAHSSSSNTMPAPTQTSLHVKVIATQSTAPDSTQKASEPNNRKKRRRMDLRLASEASTSDADGSTASQSGLQNQELQSARFLAKLAAPLPSVQQSCCASCQFPSCSPVACLRSLRKLAEQRERAAVQRLQVRGLVQGAA